MIGSIKDIINEFGKDRIDSIIENPSDFMDTYSISKRNFDIFCKLYKNESSIQISKYYSVSTSCVTDVGDRVCKNLKRYLLSLDTDELETLHLQRRVYNGLVRSGIKTVSDLVQAINGGVDISKIRNLGSKSAKEVYEKLTQKGYKLNTRLVNENNAYISVVIYDTVTKLYKGQNSWGSLDKAYLYHSSYTVDKILQENPNCISKETKIVLV